jgi:hypothetical protein
MLHQCKLCDYKTDELYNYNRHCKTKKHIRNIESPIKFSNYCEKCNKSYKCSDNYHRKFKCIQVQKEKEEQETDELTNIVYQLLQQNKEMIHQNKDMIELIKKTPTVIQNVDNRSVTNIDNSKKTFNLNIFLNEECKDAINWDEFIMNLELPSALDTTITDIVKTAIRTQLQELGMYKRPIHCLDVKRKKMYIKKDDQWEKDANANQKLIQSSFEKMKNEMFKKWENAHPKWFENEKETEIYLSFISKLSDYVQDDKCMNDMAYQTMIDHK